MFDISSIINTQAIPVFLLPLNGLLCTAFYNRYSHINARIHFLQTHIKELLGKEDKKHLKWSKEELKLLHTRSKIILFTLTCLLLSVISFCICAILITLTITNPKYFEIALTLWFLGPFLIILGIIGAICELLKSSKTVPMQSHLIRLWHEEPPL